MIAIIVITHGQFGQELVRTAQDITGRQENVIGLSVTPEMGPQDLANVLMQTIEKLPAKQEALILVDMLGGTPCNTAVLKTKDHPAEVLTGVNLYMVLSSINNRDKMNLKDLATKVAEDGRRAIVSARELLRKRLG